MDRNELLEMFPEINLLEDESYKEVVINSYLFGLELAKWDEKGGFEALPVATEGLMKPECDVPCVKHMRTVAACTKAVSDRIDPWLEKMGYKMDKQFCLTAALLHDVGKLVEFGRDENGVPCYGKYGKQFCHTTAGAYIVKKAGGDDVLVHSVLTHSHDEAPEKENAFEKPEHIIMKCCDLASFHSINVAWHMENRKLTI